MYSYMKIRFLKTLAVEIIDERMEEVWDKTFFKWAELNVESIDLAGKFAILTTYEGQQLMDIPRDAFEEIDEKKKLDIV